MRYFFIIFIFLVLPVYSEDKINSYWKLEADFNNDGLIDTAVSEPVHTFGSGGGAFTLYLRLKDQTFKEIGTFFCHPLAVRLEYLNNETKIWFYFKSSSNSG